jgi:prepilin-type N-terminal cleavage/methylation domain-containing protein
LSASSWSPSRRASGFTLIEVIGALVIFSVGVLMVMQTSGALGAQMRYAGARSQIVVLANERLESLETVPLASLSPGTVQDTITVRGIPYQRTVTVTAITPVLSRVDVSLVPIGTSGPSYAVTSYASAVW